jgi:hypothetical protein
MRVLVLVFSKNVFSAVTALAPTLCGFGDANIEYCPSNISGINFLMLFNSYLPH